MSSSNCVTLQKSSSPSLHEDKYLNEKYKVIADESLVMLWQELQKQLRVPASLQTAAEIRTWMNNTANRDKLNLITELKLCLSQQNPVNTIPPEVSFLKQIRKVDLSSNKLFHFPKELCSLSQLKELNLSHNRFIHIPDAIRGLTQLETLDVTHNTIGWISSSIGALTQLRDLKISYRLIPDPSSDPSSDLKTVLVQLSPASYSEKEIYQYTAKDLARILFVGNLLNTHNSSSSQSISSNAHSQYSPIEVGVHCDVGLGHNITIRGQGAKDLSWDKGIPLNWTEGNIWKTRLTPNSKNIELKVLRDDKDWMQGNNIVVKSENNNLTIKNLVF